MKPTNDVLIRALLREPTEYTPIWLMRQAGRFLPEYRVVRERCGSFMGLAKDKDAATEVTLQPVERFGLDAAILFSDILTVPDAMGLGLRFVAGEGPVFDHPVQDEAAVSRLYVPDPNESLRYVMDAVKSIRRALDNRVPLIGFSGSPLTLAAYMVEGKSSKDFATLKRMMYQRPDLLEQILDTNAKAVRDYLNAQIEAGAQVIQIFDTWGGMLAAPEYERFSLNYTRDVIARLNREHDGDRVPVILFTKGATASIEATALCGADCLGVDWTIALSQARQRTRGKIALQGNMDPVVLLCDEKTIECEARRVLEQGGTQGHVFNLGHGVMQATKPEAVEALVEVVHSVSRQMRPKRDVIHNRGTF